RRDRRAHRPRGGSQWTSRTPSEWILRPIHRVASVQAMTATDTRAPRLRVYREQAAASRAMNAFDSAVADTGLEPSLRELIKFRASQINGCGYCIDMHSEDARRAGETEQRLYGLTAWREAPYYTPRERAALALTEAVT